MESSSENSFTWTDTSSDTIESYSMSVGDKKVEKEKEFGSKHENKMKSKEQSNHIYNGFEDKHHEKLNVKVEQEQSYDDSYSRKKKMVKSEPGSDTDIHKAVDRSVDELQDNASYDESYLNLKVKQENMGLPSSPHKIKKKKKHLSLDAHDSNNSEILQDKTITTHEEYECQNNLSDSSTRIKKKKKKSKREYYSDDQCQIEINNKLDNEERDLDVSQEGESVCFTERDMLQDETAGCEISAINGEHDDLHALSLLDSKTIIDHNKTSKLSDRIMFEEDEEAELHNCTKKASSKLQKFLKTSSNLQMVSQKMPSNFIFTDDDDIWIIKCPNQVDIQDFCDTDLKINSKCKTKIGSQTYEISLEEEQNDSVTVLSTKHNKHEIKNISLCGRIIIRKRIPKAHISDDNIMINKQTNFIPLPDIKCRHPLFGSNYKKALKIPAAITNKLKPENNMEQLTTIEKQKKKKHKKIKTITEHQDIEIINNERLPKSEPDMSQQITEKKRKRKHIEYEDPTTKLTKRMKHNILSEDAWDSEKAIEQNLFDF